MLVYRTDDYKRLKATVEKQSKKRTYINMYIHAYDGDGYVRGFHL